MYDDKKDEIIKAIHKVGFSVTKKHALLSSELSIKIVSKGYERSWLIDLSDKSVSFKALQVFGSYYTNLYPEDIKIGQIVYKIINK